MSLDFSDPYAMLALLEKKQNQDIPIATTATFATSETNQEVTDENDLLHGCYKLLQIERTAHNQGKCSNIKQNVAGSCYKTNDSNINSLIPNVANVANIATLNIKKPLFIDDNGNPLRCTKCSYARTKYVPEEERERPYVWHGLCLLDPNELLNIVGMNSRCALITGDDYASVVQ